MVLFVILKGKRENEELRFEILEDIKYHDTSY